MSTLGLPTGFSFVPLKSLQDPLQLSTRETDSGKPKMRFGCPPSLFLLFKPLLQTRGVFLESICLKGGLGLAAALLEAWEQIGCFADGNSGAEPSLQAFRLCKYVRSQKQGFGREEQKEGECLQTACSAFRNLFLALLTAEGLKGGCELRKETPSVGRRSTFTGFDTFTGQRENGKLWKGGI